MNANKLYVIRCLDHGGYILGSEEDEKAVLVFRNKQAACNYAANHYGYQSYTWAKRDGWVEVIPLNKA